MQYRNNTTKRMLQSLASNITRIQTNQPVSKNMYSRGRYKELSTQVLLNTLKSGIQLITASASKNGTDVQPIENLINELIQRNLGE